MADYFQVKIDVARRSLLSFIILWPNRRAWRLSHSSGQAMLRWQKQSSTANTWIIVVFFFFSQRERNHTHPHALERPIKIEIITDEMPEAQARAPHKAPGASLLSRLGVIEGSMNRRPGATVNRTLTPM